MIFLIKLLDLHIGTDNVVKLYYSYIIHAFNNQINIIIHTHKLFLTIQNIISNKHSIYLMKLNDVFRQIYVLI